MRILKQQMNEFTKFDNQENVPNVDTLESTMFAVESKSSQIWSKLAQKRESSGAIEDVRCVTVHVKSKSTSRTFDRGCVFVNLSNVC